MHICIHMTIYTNQKNMVGRMSHQTKKARLDNWMPVMSSAH
jgi:hypothetical protein